MKAYKNFKINEVASKMYEGSDNVYQNTPMDVKCDKDEIVFTMTNVMLNTQ
jgi:hypothetical protein